MTVPTTILNTHSSNKELSRHQSYAILTKIRVESTLTTIIAFQRSSSIAALPQSSALDSDSGSMSIILSTVMVVPIPLSLPTTTYPKAASSTQNNIQATGSGATVLPLAMELVNAAGNLCGCGGILWIIGLGAAALLL